jgi:transposase-like protein
MPIKREDKKWYLKNPNYCPFCKAAFIKQETDPYYEECRFYQEFSCTECGRTWKDVYHLMDVVTAH